LLVELGKRIQNAKVYEEELNAGGIKLGDLPFFTEREKRWLGSKQPLRTDFEALLSNDNFAEEEIES
jgi:hypothetical protein